jgi:hypothetical protein
MIDGGLKPPVQQQLRRAGGTPALQKPESTGKIAYATLTSIEGWVADVAASYEVDYIFGNIGGVVADAF